MAERKVVVKISAQVNEYLDAMEKVSQKTRETGTEAEKLGQKKDAFDLLGKTALTAGGVMAAGIGLAVTKFAEFDEAMSFVQASTHETAENMDLLRQAALDAGASTVFSATEAANAIEELAKAGISTEQILGGGLKGALDLAAAGGIGVADAAGIAATALTQFKLEGSDVPHVADLLAAGAGKAMGSVEDLSAALNQSGLVASSTGLSIEETTGTLSAFASAGLLGSDAGTSFKTMLQSLNPRSAEAASLMEEYNLQAYDAQGNFVGMEEYAGKLAAGLGKMSDEQRNATLSTIFGSDAVRAATVLYEEGSAGIGDWITAVDDQGYAAETAAMRLDNLKGDIEALGGAFDTALIQMGSGADGPLRLLVQSLTELVDKFNGLPAGAQQAVLGIGAVASAASLGLGAFFSLVPKIAEYRDALATLGPTAQKTGRALSAFTRVAGTIAALGTAVFVIEEMSAALAEKFGPSAEETANSVLTATSAVEQFRAAMTERFSKDMGLEGAQSAVEGLAAALDDSAANQANFFDGVSAGNGEILATYRVLGKELGALAGSDLPAAQAQFRQLAEDAGLTSKQITSLINESPEFKDALTAQASAAGLAADDQTLLNLAMGKSAGVTETAAGAYVAASEEVEGLTAELDQLLGLINEANETNQDAISANADWQAALAGVSAEVESQKAAYEEANGTLDGFTLSLDRATESGAANAAGLSDVAAAAQDAAFAQYEVDKTTMSAQEATDKYIETLSANRQAFIDGAVAAGYNKDEVTKLADEVYKLPTKKEIDLLVDTAGALNEINSFIQRNTGRVVKLRVEGESGRAVAGSDVIAKADGGAIYGPGGPRSDLIPAMLSNGEHVLTAAEVRAMGGQEAVYRFRAGLGRGFADGGAVVGAGPTVNVSAPSMAGAVFRAEIDGRPFTMMIREQISAASAADARVSRQVIGS